MIGATLSHYRIDAELGRGGMGIVYKATDTKLNRTVALKVLPSAALASEDDRARFFREAQAAAQLTHPNIATVYQIDEAVASDAPHGTEPSPFIAMEFIEGETLEARIKKAPLKLGDALRIATEIATGLKAAHAKNIVHRDIKAANIMLGEDERAKILDFGLALTAQSTKLTRMGSTLGTIAYMSPEQARGEEVDLRTDLWAIGVVLYEMIAGTNPFGGDYEQAMIYNILNTDPEPLTALRTGVPMELESITSKALRKSADLRYQTAADLIADLNSIDLKKGSTVSSIVAPEAIPGATPGAIPRADPGTIPKPSPRIRHPRTERFKQAGLAPVAVFIFIGVVLGILIGSMWTGGHTPASETEPVRRFQISTLPYMNADWPLVSPNGDAVSYAGFDTSRGVTVLALYDLKTMETRELASDTDLFPMDFSPDGDWILYSTPNSLRIVRRTGGQSLDLVTVSFGVGTWENNESVLYRALGSIYRVGVDGSPPYLIASVDSLRGHREFYIPVHVPGTTLAFTTLARYDGGFDIGLVDTDTGTYEVVLEGANFMGFSPNGYMMYRSGPLDGPMRVRKFDIQRREFESRPVPYQPDANESGTGILGHDGTLVVTEKAVYYGSRVFELTLDSGLLNPVEAPTGVYNELQMSDNGNLLAVEERLPEGGTAIMVIDLENGTKTRVAGSQRRDNPLFLNDEFVVFDSRAADQRKLYRQPIYGGIAEEIPTSGQFVSEPSLHPDGDRIIYRHVGLDQKDQIRSVSLSTGKEEVVADPNRVIFDPVVSPDGAFVAYETIRENQDVTVNEVHVSSYGREGSWVVGTGPVSMIDPMWSKDGRYLYFQDANFLYRVRVLPGSGFQYSRMETVVRIPVGARISLDGSGKRAILVAQDAAVNPTHIPIRFIQNFASSLADLIPDTE